MVTWLWPHPESIAAARALLFEVSHFNAAARCVRLLEVILHGIILPTSEDVMEEA